MKLTSTCNWRAWLLALLLLATYLSPAQAQRVSVSQNYTLSVHADGTLWAWGDDSNRQLGLGSRTFQAYQSSPQQVGTDANWASVSAGYTHVLALKTDGTLWAWGYNGFGQLGLGTSYGYMSTPIQVGTASDWVSVSTGYNCSLAIRANGTLWGWGYLSEGETGLGLGTATIVSQPTPTQVGTATTWRSVRAGQGHALAVQTDGSLWAWGYNGLSQLGLGTTTPTFVGSPTRVGTATNWASTSAGTGYSLAVKSDGTLWTWGSNNNGQLGDGTTTDHNTPQLVGTATTWASVSAGSGFALATRQDGTLWAWGLNRWGQLGNGQVNTPGQLTPQPVGTASNWASVSAGYGHAVALRHDGSLWAWGGNYQGQLGNGGGPQLLPGQVAAGTTWSSLAVGNASTLGIRADGSLWACGSNYAGQLGIGNTTDQDAPVAVGTSTWQSVSATADVTLAIRPDGSLWAWGSNYRGQLGTGAGADAIAANPVRVGTASTWKTVSVGLNHVLALQTDGSLWAWGSNAFSQLGTGSTNTIEPTPVRVGSATWLSIGAGWMHSAAVRQDGTLWTWGQNTNGQLGTGLNTPSSSSTPTRVGTDATWRSVSAGVYYTLALKTNGTLWAWGQNRFGEVGAGSLDSFVLTPTQVGTATTWRSISAAGYSSLGLRQDGTLWVWGANYYGQLGLGTTTAQPSPVQQSAATWQSAGMGGEHGAGIRTDGTFWTWGYNNQGQLGNGQSGSAQPRYVANGGAPLATHVAASTAPSWALAPNPAHGHVQLTGLPAGPVAVRLFDAQGRLVRTTAATTLELAGLAPGLYLVQATAGPTTHTQRLTVE